MDNDKKNIISFSSLEKKQEESDYRFITEEEMNLFYEENEVKMKRVDAIDNCLADLIMNPDAPEIVPVSDGFMKGTGNALLCFDINMPFEIGTQAVKDAVLKIIRLADYIYVVERPEEAAMGVVITVYDALKKKSE